MASAALMVLASCQKEESNSTTILPEDNVMHFTTNVDKTRAGVDSDNLSYFYVSVDSNNDRYDYDNVSVNKIGGVWTPMSMLLWENEDAAVTITATSPSYVSKDTPQFSINTDQQSELSVKRSDFIMAQAEVTPSSPDNTKSIYYDANSKKVNIEFSHIFSKITVNLVINDEFDLQTNPVGKLKIDGTNITVKDVFDLSKGSESQSIVYLYRNDNYAINSTGTAATVSYEGILIPQVIEANNFKVNIEINGETYNWTSDSEITLESNKKHTLTLEVGKNQIRPLSMTITDWEDAGESNVATE